MYINCLTELLECSKWSTQFPLTLQLHDCSVHSSIHPSIHVFIHHERHLQYMILTLKISLGIYFSFYSDVKIEAPRDKVITKHQQRNKVPQWGLQFLLLHPVSPNYRIIRISDLVMIDFMCQLHKAVIPRYLTKHLPRCFCEDII